MRPYKLLPLIAITLAACSSADSPKTAVVGDTVSSTVETNKEEGFDSFNERFHSDSAFQLSRTSFPIGGIYADGDMKFKWSAKNWTLLKEPVKATIESTEFKHSFQKTDTNVIEKYWIEDSGFKLERRFKKKDGKWFLTFYEDVEI